MTTILGELRLRAWIGRVLRRLADRVDYDKAWDPRARARR